MKNANFTWILLFIPLTILCASKPKAAEISGRVVDADSKEPLPYANIIYGQKGTSSNEDGHFVLKVSDQNSKQITFKYMGYESRSINLDDMSENHEVELSPKAEMLESVTVYRADQVIADLLNHYQINYEYSDLLLKAYYKESIQAGNNFYYIGEGLFNIYLPTIYSEDEIQVEKVKTRKHEYDLVEELKLPHVTGHVSDMVNAATRRKHSFLSKDGHNHYSFQKEEYSYYDGREIFVISFEPKDKHARSRGTLYIDAESKAIIKAVYYPLIEIQEFWTFAKWTEEYKEIDGTWYIHRVSYSGEWIQEGEIIAYDANMIITDTNAIHGKPQFTNILAENAALFDEASNFSDTFWAEQNYLKLTEEERLSVATSE